MSQLEAERGGVTLENDNESDRFLSFGQFGFDLHEWILGKLKAASDESYRDFTNLEAKIQAIMALKADVEGRSDEFVSFNNTGHEMIQEGRYDSEAIQKALNTMDEILKHFFSLVTETQKKQQEAVVQASALAKFLRQCNEAMFWINGKVLYYIP